MAGSAARGNGGEGADGRPAGEEGPADVRTGAREGGAWLDAPAQYVSWNFVLISIPNIVMIAGMIVVFVLALLAPFPHDESGQGRSDGHHD